MARQKIETKLRTLYNAEVIATGKRIEVYRHRTGTFIDYSDCGIEYFAKDIIILNEIKE